MGLFGGSKSKSSSNASQVGSQTQLGDPISINVGGGKKSHTTISVEKVDFGAVDRSFSLAEDSLGLGYWLTGQVLDSSNGVLARSDAASERLLVAGSNASKDILSASRGASNDILEAASMEAGRIGNFSLAALDGALDFSRDIIQAGQNNAGVVERLAESFQSFIDDQNNPNENNQMLLIAGAVGLLAVVVLAGK